MPAVLDHRDPAAPRWHVRLLGDVQATDAQGTVIARWPSRAVALLLARLAMAPQRAHPREELVDLLWPEAPLDVGRNRLRQVLSTLKSLLEAADSGAVIVADRASVRVAPQALACDVLEFEACVRAKARERAFALYRGPLMPGHFDEWVLEQRQRLETLAERMDFDSLRASVPRSTPAESPPALDTEPVAASLPSYLTRLHGAQTVLAETTAAVQAQRLVCIVGPGGCGKTRLAVEVARAVSGTARFDLIAFVSLVTAASAGAVRDALGQALQCDASREALIAALGGRHALLVLDNCEQVLADAGREAAFLLERLPQLHLLATSRRALGVDGEQALPLPTLATPHEYEAPAALAANPAVALFVDRARQARADFHLGAGNAAAVAGLVRWLDGMPLAIELAAARVRSLGPAQMLALLQREPADALALVARAGARGGTDVRHASMAEVVAWSWRLLGAEARALMADMALFPGGFTLEAAQAVCGASLAETAAWLDELVEQSMLRPALDGERFAPYEVIREFALSQLPPQREAAVRALQRRWLLDWARALPVTPPLAAVRAEMPNIVAALAAGEADASAAADVVELLARMRRCFEDVELPAAGLRHLERAIDACDNPRLASRGHSLIAGLVFNAGRADDALHHARAGLDGVERDDALAYARALHAQASVGWRATKDAAASLALIEQAEPLAQAAAAPDVQASLCALRAFIVGQKERNSARAQALHQRALELWREQGNQHAVNSGLYNLAVVASRSGAAPQALELLDQVLASARRHGDGHRERQALNVQGNALIVLKRWREASQVLRECVRQSWRATAAHDLAYGLWNLPRALAHLRQPETALRLMAFAQAHWSRHFGVLSAEDRHDLRLIRRLAGLGVAVARVDALWCDGEQLTLAEAVALALDGAAA
jgi:predicted ATPase